MADTKRALRRSMRRRRATITPEEAAEAARAAAGHLVSLPECQAVIARGGLVAIYAGMRNEISTVPLAEELAARGCALAYPRVVPGKLQLTFHRVSAPEDLAPATFGIPEPRTDAPLAPVERIEMFVVPGLAFDRSGNRLGWGRGHYDATLHHNPEALRVGLAYESQIVESVPRGAHDLPMHIIVTDAGALRRPAR